MCSCTPTLAAMDRLFPGRGDDWEMRDTSLRLAVTVGFEFKVNGRRIFPFRSFLLSPSQSDLLFYLLLLDEEGTNAHTAMSSQYFMGTRSYCLQSMMWYLCVSSRFEVGRFLISHDV